MRVIDKRKDERSECESVLVIMKLEEYKELIYLSYCDSNENGSIKGQRGVIKRSAAANKIKKRMQDDFNRGAVFPQVVIGMLLKKNPFENINCGHEFTLNDIDNKCFSIIDGMQRSYIYFTNYENNEETEIRVEFWIANKSVKLLYRMMVLNTGQVPWNTRRQLEVIFSNLSNNIEEELYIKNPELKGKIEILGVDDGKKRSKSGRYNKSTIIEIYLGFNTRKVKVNVTDELADEFQRFDMMESLEKPDSLDYFVEVFALLCKLDIALSSFEGDKDVYEGQFKAGKDIFTSVPACIGFIVACAEFIMGKNSIERTDEVKVDKLHTLKENVSKIIKRVVKEAEKDSDFIGLESLNAVNNELPKTSIGDEARRMFKTAFTEMIRCDDFEEIPELGTFWRE